MNTLLSPWSTLSKTLVVCEWRVSEEQQMHCHERIMRMHTACLYNWKRGRVRAPCSQTKHLMHEARDAATGLEILISRIKKSHPGNVFELNHVGATANKRATWHPCHIMLRCIHINTNTLPLCLIIYTSNLPSMILTLNSWVSKGSDFYSERTLEINTEAQSMLHEVLRVAHLAHVAQQIHEIKNQ